MGVGRGNPRGWVDTQIANSAERTSALKGKIKGSGAGIGEENVFCASEKKAISHLAVTHPRKLGRRGQQKTVRGRRQAGKEENLRKIQVRENSSIAKGRVERLRKVWELGRKNRWPGACHGEKTRYRESWEISSHRRKTPVGG